MADDDPGEAGSALVQSGKAAEAFLARPHQ